MCTLMKQNSAQVTLATTVGADAVSECAAPLHHNYQQLSSAPYTTSSKHAHTMDTPLV